MEVAEELRAASRWTQSHGEEIANSLSHAVGFLAAAVGTPVLLDAAWERGSTPSSSGAPSSRDDGAALSRLRVYHFWPRTRFKGALQVADHSQSSSDRGDVHAWRSAAPRPAWGWTILTIVWALALFGVL
jgi:hemolysin III